MAFLDLEGLKYFKDKENEQIAPVESGTTASKDYAVEKLFWLGGNLCKAKTNITQGDTFVENTNYTVTTLEAELDYFKENYAQIDGYYEGMTVGNAEQLVSTVGIEDKTPYNFRTSGGSADIGDRETDMVVGGTIAWNQLQKNDHSRVNSDVTYTYNGGKLTASGTATANSWWCDGNSKKWDFYKDHIYLLSAVGNYTFTGGLNPYWYVPDNVFSPSSIQNAQEVVRKSLKDSNTYFQFMVYPDNEVDYTFTPMVFDLTQMFGSAIADYIYSLETANAGAGVAWFKHLFPKPYYSYNAGQLMSVNTSAHKTVGFNAWDEQWENGTFDTSNGSPLNVGSPLDQIRTKNLIPVVGGASYYIKANPNIWMFFYDASKTLITDIPTGAGKVNNASQFGEQVKTQNPVTMPANCCYVKFYCQASYGSSYRNDICINLSWDGERDGEYERYEEHIYPLDESLTLRGIPKLDANNNLYYDGDTYESDGTVTRKYAKVVFGVDIIGGLITWYSADSDPSKNTWGFYYNYNTTAFPYTFKQNQIICDKFTRINTSVYGSDNPYTCASYYPGSNGYISFRIPKSAIGEVTDGNDLTDKINTWIQANPFTVVGEILTSTIESAESYQNQQIVNDFGTEEYTDYGVEQETREVAVPVGHVTLYVANLRAKLEMAPDSPDGDGDYIVRQTNGENEYVPLIIPQELPDAPTTDGTYRLQVVISNGTATLSWVSAT